MCFITPLSYMCVMYFDHIRPCSLSSSLPISVDPSVFSSAFPPYTFCWVFFGDQVSFVLVVHRSLGEGLFIGAETFISFPQLPLTALLLNPQGRVWFLEPPLPPRQMLLGQTLCAPSQVFTAAVSSRVQCSCCSRKEAFNNTPSFLQLARSFFSLFSDVPGVLGWV